LLALAAGCVPYAIPPATVDVGGLRSTEQGTRTGIHVDAGFSPMQLMPTQFNRRWDAMLAGSFDRFGSHNTWGGAVAAGPIFFPFPVNNPDARVRLLPQVIGRLSTDASSIGARVAIEYVTFTSGSASDSNGGGVSYGEAAIGGYIESGYRSDDELVITAGLTLRIPVIAGVSCCLH
jgi:hypothetical protein